MIFVVAGLVVVGLADIMFGTNAKDDINGVITGKLKDLYEISSIL